MALLDVAAAVLERLGYAGLALLVAVENLVPPVPSEVILPLAGVLVQQGRFSFLPAVAAATVGSVVGAWVLYEVARRVGEERLERFVRRRGRWLLLRPEDLARVRGWFGRHGSWAVVLGRLLPGARSVVSLPAGLSGMPRTRFLALTAVGSAAWNAALIAAGMAVGSATQQVQGFTTVVEVLVLVAAGVLVARFVLRRLRLLPERKKAPRREG